MNWQIVLSVGFGGFAGATSRFLLSSWVQKLTGSNFPYGTLSVNVAGSFAIGFLVLYFEQTLSPQYKALVVTGFLGALTTFSTFSLETVMMLQQNLYLKAISNVSLNVVLCITATILGMMFFRRVYGG
ncbi:MAG: fluoride efflux transporter CrcB [Sulfurovum sp.]|nr:fluoride efflux transporter CrcB [Sulfurovum sp.]